MVSLVLQDPNQKGSNSIFYITMINSPLADLEEQTVPDQCKQHHIFPDTQGHFVTTEKHAALLLWTNQRKAMDAVDPPETSTQLIMHPEYYLNA